MGRCRHSCVPKASPLPPSSLSFSGGGTRFHDLNRMTETPREFFKTPCAQTTSRSMKSESLEEDP